MTTTNICAAKMGGEPSPTGRAILFGEKNHTQDFLCMENKEDVGVLVYIENT